MKSLTFNLATTTLLAFAVALPSIASAQLTSRERQRATELARIQAKADAEERARERWARRDSALALCESSRRQWDFANNICKPR